MNQPRQLCALETGEPGPEADEGGLRLLRLKPDKVMNGTESRGVFSGQQHLPGEQGAIERAAGYDVVFHAVTICDMAHDSRRRNIAGGYSAATAGTGRGAARYVNRKGADDILWVKGQNRDV